MREDGVAGVVKNTVEIGKANDDFASDFQVKIRDPSARVTKGRGSAETSSGEVDKAEAGFTKVDFKPPKPVEPKVLYLCAPLVVPPPTSPVRRILLISRLEGLLYYAKPVIHLGSWTLATTVHVVKEKLIVIHNQTQEFLCLCGTWFLVAIWASERRTFINALRPLLCNEHTPEFVFVWAKEKCTRTYKFGVDKETGEMHELLLKKLSLVFVVYGEHGVNMKNKFLVNGTPLCALANLVYSGIFLYNPPPPCTLPYVPNNYLLGHLWPYLLKLSDNTDTIPNFVRQNAFGQPPIGLEDAIHQYAKEFVCGSADNPDNLSN